MLRIGVDVGGTFTDVCLYDPAGRRLDTYKSPTTVADPVVGVSNAVDSLAKSRSQTLSELLAMTEAIIYGTTLSTNALVTHRTAKVGLLCTDGFREILSLREGGKDDPFNWKMDYPEPYVPRELTLPIRERVTSEGEVLVPLDASDAELAVQRLRQEDVQVIAVAYLWSFLNPEHELLTRAIVERDWPGVPCVLSHEVNPIPREYRRTVATAIDASLQPLVRPHLESLESFLHTNGFRGELLVASCGGGVMSIPQIAARPIYTVGSGPTMAPIAAGEAVRLAGSSGKSLLVVDMGGTSFDISLVRDGQVLVSRETVFGDDMLGIAAVDVRSIGAGGGSIAWVDAGGLVRVGPDSAGAEPGPACYGRGGTAPTVTDAAVVLGYLGTLVGQLPLNAAAAADSIRTIAEKLGDDVTSTAHTVYATVNQNMLSGIRATASREGIDPADTTLISGGGASGVHVAALAQELGIREVLIPAQAGTLSAFGALVSDISHEFSAAFHMRSDAPDLDGLNATLEGLRAKAQEFLAHTGRPREMLTILGTCECRYLSQIWELDVPLATLSFGLDDIPDLVGAFHSVHDRVHGVAQPDEVVEFLQWRVRAVARTDSLGAHEVMALPDMEEKRLMYFEGLGWVEGRVMSGQAATRAGENQGPAVIQERTTTILVPPGWHTRFEPGVGYILSANTREAASDFALQLTQGEIA